MLRHGSKRVADVLSIQPEFLATFIQATESDVDVRMLGVEMRDRRPFERRVEIGFHPAHHVSRPSRCKSSRSPNSGEIISFQSRGSPSSCHSREIV